MSSLDVLAEAAKFIQDDEGNSISEGSPQSGLRKFRHSKQGRSQSRETHNRLEKNRRAELKNYFQRLKNNIPNLMNKHKASTVCILYEAKLYIEELRSVDKQNERERISLHRCRICLEERLKMLKIEINRMYLNKQLITRAASPCSDSDETEMEIEVKDNDDDDITDVKKDDINMIVDIKINDKKEMASVEIQANEDEIQAENLPIVFPRIPPLSESAARFDVTALHSDEENNGSPASPIKSEDEITPCLTPQPDIDSTAITSDELIPSSSSTSKPQVKLQEIATLLTSSSEKSPTKDQLLEKLDIAFPPTSSKDLLMQDGTFANIPILPAPTDGSMNLLGVKCPSTSSNSPNLSNTLTQSSNTSDPPPKQQNVTLIPQCNLNALADSTNFTMTKLKNFVSTTSCSGAQKPANVQNIVLTAQSGNVVTKPQNFVIAPNVNVNVNQLSAKRKNIMYTPTSNINQSLTNIQGMVFVPATNNGQTLTKIQNFVYTPTACNIIAPNANNGTQPLTKIQNIVYTPACNIFTPTSGSGQTQIQKPQNIVFTPTSTATSDQSLTKLQSMVYRVGNIEMNVPIAVTNGNINLANKDNNFLTCTPLQLANTTILTNNPQGGNIEPIKIDRVGALHQVVNLQFLQPPKEQKRTGESDDTDLKICEND